MCRILMFVGMASLLAMVAVMADAQENALWMDPRSQPLEPGELGPFLQNDDGSLLMMENKPAE